MFVSAGEKTVALYGDPIDMNTINSDSARKTHVMTAEPRRPRLGHSTVGMGNLASSVSERVVLS